MKERKETMNSSQGIYDLTITADSDAFTQALLPKYVNKEITEIEYFVGRCCHLDLKNSESETIKPTELKNEIDKLGSNLADRIIIKTADRDGNSRHLEADCNSIFNEYEILLIGLDTDQIFADQNLKPEKTALLLNLNLSYLSDTTSGFIYAPPLASKETSDHLVRAIFFSELD